MSSSGSTTSYVYDGDGKRTRKTTGSNTTSYVYDVNSSLPVVLEENGRKYVWGVGLAYAVDSASTVQVYHTDGLGSVRAVTDLNRNLIERQRTDAYGNQPAEAGTIDQSFGFTGEQRDAETGLVYLRVRYYDPCLRRFLSRDIVNGDPAKPGTLNRCAYALGDPTRFAEPSGHEVEVAAVDYAWWDWGGPYLLWQDDLSLVEKFGGHDHEFAYRLEPAQSRQRPCT